MIDSDNNINQALVNSVIIKRMRFTIGEKTNT